MNLETLKRAAEWVGYMVLTDANGEKFLHHQIDKDDIDFDKWTPHEDANLLKKMEEKLTPEQWEKYHSLLYDYYVANMHEIKMIYTHWFKTAPTKLCFEKLMEVI